MSGYKGGLDWRVATPDGSDRIHLKGLDNQLRFFMAMISNPDGRVLAVLRGLNAEIEAYLTAHNGHGGRGR